MNGMGMKLNIDYKKCMKLTDNIPEIFETIIHQ